MDVPTCSLRQAGTINVGRIRTVLTVWFGCVTPHRPVPAMSTGFPRVIDRRQQLSPGLSLTFAMSRSLSLYAIVKDLHSFQTDRRPVYYVHDRELVPVR